MLKKLIRYEFQATRRIFLPAFLVVLVLSIANGISLRFCGENMSLPSGLLLTVYILALFTVFVLAFVYMVERFYTNLLHDEGYLMFTLPARPSQLIWAKCITSSIWFVLTGIICGISLFILMTTVISGDITLSMLFGQIRYGLAQVSGYINPISLTLFIIELIVLVILSLANFILHIYACLSIGSLSNKYRLLVAFLAYLAFGVVEQFVLMIAASLGMGFNLSFSSLNQLIQWINNASPFASLHFTMLLSLIYIIICMAVNFIITNYILSKRLNLE